jgi:hypothetical protein
MSQLARNARTVAAAKAAPVLPALDRLSQAAEMTGTLPVAWRDSIR